MIPNLLYKYLDFEGCLKMLRCHNLQFTHASRLNDPFDCHPSLVPCEFQPKTKNRKRNSDIKELRFYPPIGRECFCSLYLGVNMEQEKQKEIVKVARKLNPEMKIIKMTVDPDAFRLKPEPIDILK